MLGDACDNTGAWRHTGDGRRYEILADHVDGVVRNARSTRDGLAVMNKWTKDGCLRVARDEEAGKL